MKAFSQAVEEAEDQTEAGASELVGRNLSEDDFVVGISASGRTPFVVGALAEARRVGAGTASIFCNPGAPVASAADWPILLEVGPEILTGSTRLKAGTATKLVLNQISTAAMVRSGRCLGNLMIDLTPACEKLRDRSARIVARAAQIGEEDAEQYLARANGEVRTAILMAVGRLEAGPAREMLEHLELREALAQVRS